MADSPFGSFARAVNNHGVIVGYVDNADGTQRAAIWTPIPSVVP